MISEQVQHAAKEACMLVRVPSFEPHASHSILWLMMNIAEYAPNEQRLVTIIRY